MNVPLQSGRPFIKYRQNTICRLMNDFYPLDSRGLEVCGHGGRPGAVVALFLRHHRWDGRDPHGRAAHL